MNLIVHLTPYLDESLHGFLRRVSERNLAPGVKAFLSSFGMRFRPTFSDIELARLAGILGIDAEDLAIRQWSPDNRNPMLRPKHQSVERDKVCPRCIEEQPYRRIGWAHILVTACPRHGILLLTKCAACGDDINADGQLDHCACGHPYAQGPTRSASDQALGLSALLLGVEHVCRHSLPPTWSTGVPVGDTVDVLCLLGQQFTHDSRVAPLPKPSRGRASSDDVIAWGQIGFDLLLQWPSRFDQVLSARLASTEGPGLAKRLGGWYRALHQRYVDPAHDCLREALVQHLTLNFDGHLNLRISTIDPQHLKEKCWLTSEEAGRLIGIGAQLVRSAVMTGEIRGKQSVKGMNRFVSIHRDVAEEVRQDRLRFVTSTEVRRRLGVSKVVFERLMQSGALDKKTKAQRPPLVSAEFLARDVDTLISRLSEGVQSRPVDRSLWAGLQDISIKRGIPDASICVVMQKILLQDIRPVAVLPGVSGIGGLRFDLTEIKECLEEKQPEHALSITELSRLQGWKHESIKSWIDAGFLQARIEQIQGQSRVVIPLGALLEFMSEFAVLADLARRTSTKSVWLLRGLMPAGISPVLAPEGSKGVKRGLLLRIDDLVAASQLNKRGQPQGQQASV